MTIKYIYLLSRNLTEKEAVSRRQYVRTNKIDDDVVKVKLPIRQCLKNIWSNLVRKSPKSVIDIAEEMNRPENCDVTDHRIEGMDRERFDSSSSSSSDELPDFLKPKPLNISYPQNQNVLIIGVDGKILGSVPQNEFTKQNPSFNQYLNPENKSNEESKINPFFPPYLNPISPPSVPLSTQDLSNNFSAKYKEKLDKEKEQTSSAINGDSIMTENSIDQKEMS